MSQVKFQEVRVVIITRWHLANSECDYGQAGRETLPGGMEEGIKVIDYKLR